MTNKVYCTPACEYWVFGKDPACNTVAVGECRRYDCPTEKLGTCPPKSYSKYNPFKIFKKVLGLEKKL